MLRYAILVVLLLGLALPATASARAWTRSNRVRSQSVTAWLSAVLTGDAQHPSRNNQNAVRRAVCDSDNSMAHGRSHVR
jgi:hypothetical protein